MSDFTKERKPRVSYEVTKRYQDKKYDRTVILTHKGKKEKLKLHAASRGESLNAFINRCIDETIARDLAK